MFENPCQDGYQYALGHRLCYKLVQEKQSQFDAQVFCKTRGAQLLQIRSDVENQIVTDYLSKWILQWYSCTLMIR